MTDTITTASTDRPSWPETQAEVTKRKAAQQETESR